MSIIEKALSKISLPASKPNGITSASVSQWRHRPPSSDKRNTLKQDLAHAQPALALDYADLRKKGVIAQDDMTARVNDEFRRIKRPLLANVASGASRLTQHGNLIMVTSSVAGEGKTHIAINLAVNMAREVDHTILLVDADVIKRETSELLGIADRPGLMDLLLHDDVQVEDTLLRTDISHLVVLPAGQFHEQATELLSSCEMRRVADELSTRYPERIIIFDSPPLLGTAEAQVIAGLMDQIVLVVEAGRTSPDVTEEALSLLDKSKPIGLVLNKSRQLLSADDYGDYYKRQADAPRAKS